MSRGVRVSQSVRQANALASPRRLAAVGWCGGRRSRVPLYRWRQAPLRTCASLCVLTSLCTWMYAKLSSRVAAALLTKWDIRTIFGNATFIFFFSFYWFSFVSSFLLLSASSCLVHLMRYYLFFTVILVCYFTFQCWFCFYIYLLFYLVFFSFLCPFHRFYRLRFVFSVIFIKQILFFYISFIYSSIFKLANYPFQYSTFRVNFTFKIILLFYSSFLFNLFLYLFKFLIYLFLLLLYFS